MWKWIPSFLCGCLGQVSQLQLLHSSATKYFMKYWPPFADIWHLSRYLAYSTSRLQIYTNSCRYLASSPKHSQIFTYFCRNRVSSPSNGFQNILEISCIFTQTCRKLQTPTPKSELHHLQFCLATSQHQIYSTDWQLLSPSFPFDLHLMPHLFDASKYCCFIYLILFFLSFIFLILYKFNAS